MGRLDEPQFQPEYNPQAYPPKAATPQAYPPLQEQPQAYPPHQPQPQAYSPAPANMGGYPGMSGTPNMGFPVGVEGWNSSLFDCMEDPQNALITALFPCVTFGQIAEIVDNGQTPCATSAMLYGFFACIMSCTYRTRLRTRYGLIESPASDWVTHLFCQWCALCQEYRELTARGFDPAIGWQGNLLKQQKIQMQQATMVPPTNQTMMG